MATTLQRSQRDSPQYVLELSEGKCRIQGTQDEVIDIRDQQRQPDRLHLQDRVSGHFYHIQRRILDLVPVRKRGLYITDAACQSSELLSHDRSLMVWTLYTWILLYTTSVLKTCSAMPEYVGNMQINVLLV